MNDKPPWTDAPEWATHLLVRNTANGREYAWAELVEGMYLGEKEQEGPQQFVRGRFVMGAWRVAEERPVEPARRSTGEFVTQQVQQYRAAQAAAASIDELPVMWQYRFLLMPGTVSDWIEARTPEGIAQVQAMAREQPEKVQVRALYARPAQPLTLDRINEMRMELPAASSLLSTRTLAEVVRATERFHHIGDQ